MNVLIVDDEPLAREGIALLLKDESAIGALARSAQRRRGGREDPRVAAGPRAARRADARDGRLRRVARDRRRADAAGDLRDGVRQVRHPGVRGERRRLSTQAGDARAVFAGAGARARTRSSSRARDNQHVFSLLQQLAAPPKHLARVALRSAGKISFVNVDDILYRAGGGELRAVAPEVRAASAARADRDARGVSSIRRSSCAFTAR